LFATERQDPKKPGRIKRVYRHQDVVTPLETLTTLPDVGTYLRPNVTLDALRQQANVLSDLQAAQALNQATLELFRNVIPKAA